MTPPKPVANPIFGPGTEEQWAADSAKARSQPSAEEGLLKSWAYRWYPLIFFGVAGAVLLLAGAIGFWGTKDHGLFNEISTSGGAVLVIAAIAGSTVERLLFSRISGLVSEAVEDVKKSASDVYAEKFFTDRYGERIWAIIRPNLRQVRERVVGQDFICNAVLSKLPDGPDGAMELEIERDYVVYNDSKDTIDYTPEHNTTSTFHEPRLITMFVGGKQVDQAGKDSKKGCTQEGGRYEAKVSCTVPIPPGKTAEIKVIQSEQQYELDHKAVIPVLPTELFTLSVRYPKDFEVTFHYAKSMKPVESDPMSRSSGTLSRQLVAQNVFPNAAFVILWKKKVPPAEEPTSTPAIPSEADGTQPKSTASGKKEGDGGKANPPPVPAKPAMAGNQFGTTS
jgi:hypothetical protein